MISAPANDARTEPAEFRSRRSRVRLAFNLPGTIGSEELAKIRAGFASHPGATMRKLVGPDVLLKVLCRIQRPTSFQHDHTESAFGEDLRRRPASRAGADDADVVNLGRASNFSHEKHSAKSVDPSN